MRWRREIHPSRERSREEDLERELEAHLELESQEQQEAGLPPEEARHAANRALGNTASIKEEVRDLRRWNKFEQLAQDLRYALRMLRKNPGFAVIAIFTLALGIGANTAIFSLVEAVILRPLPYADPDRVFIVWESNLTQLNQPKIFVSLRDFIEWQRHATQFEGLATYTWAAGDQTLTGLGEPRPTLALPATWNLFSVLGVSAQYGRSFVAADETGGCSVVLSHGFWQSVLGGDRSRVGTTLTLDNESCRIVGVMPASFALYPAETEIWSVVRPTKPMITNLQTQMPTTLMNRHLQVVVGRLKPNATPSAAAAELEAMRRSLEQKDNDHMSNVGVKLYHIQDEFTWLAGRNLRSGLLLLLSIVGFVLLIACLNVANLFLERSIYRQRELSIRAALGSGRRRLVQQLLTESLVLSLLGALLGVGIAASSLVLFRAMRPFELPPGAQVKLDLPVLLFTLAISVLTGVLFGALPARRATRFDLRSVLNQGAHASASRSEQWITCAIVIAQIGLCMMLLFGAELLIESAVRMASSPLGINAQSLLTFHLNLPLDVYRTGAQQADFFEQLEDRLRALAGVRQAAYATTEPLSPGSSSSVVLEDRPEPEAERAPLDVAFTPVSTNYFDTLGMALQRGRRFDATDLPTSGRVAIVNRVLVERYFSGQDPVGKRIRAGEAGSSWLTIVGVVDNTKKVDVFHEMGWLVQPQVYEPMAQQPSPSAVFVVRTNSKPMALVPTLQSAVSEMNKSLALRRLTTVEDRLVAITAAPRFRAMLTAIFACLALLLAAVGIYGVLSQSVTQRQREIGIRMALGAESAEILQLILSQGARMIVAGTAAGLIIALALGRLLSAFLFGVRPTDPLLFSAGAGILVLVAVLATYTPARRASKIDPIVALRCE